MEDSTFNEFYKDLKATEKKDSTLTPKQQIDRLLKPGSTYRYGILIKSGSFLQAETQDRKDPKCIEVEHVAINAMKLIDTCYIMDILELSGLHTPPLHTHKGAPEVQLKRKT